MANSYTDLGTGIRWVEDDGVFEDYLNVSRHQADYLHEALNTIMDSVESDGVLQPKIQAFTDGATPKAWSVEVDSGVNWTNAFWQSADNRWWWLWNTANPSSFVRADAEFYIPMASLADVPTS